MEFLCDVHISYKVVRFLIKSGFKATHVNEILDKWHTKDGDICEYADSRDLILVTKDVDFKNSYLINNTPKKLIKINLGNISNVDLLNKLDQHLSAIQKLNKKEQFLIEIDSKESFYSNL